MVPESKVKLSVPSELEILLARDYIARNVKEIGGEMAASGVALVNMIPIQEVLSVVAQAMGLQMNEMMRDYLGSLVNYGYVLRQTVEQNPAPTPDQIARGVN